MDPVWSLLIVGTSFVPWVELPVQRRLCPIFISGVGLPTSMNISRVDGLSTDPREMGHHIYPFCQGRFSLISTQSKNVLLDGDLEKEVFMSL